MILANDWAIREHTDPPMSEMLPTATRVEASPEENQSKSIVSIFKNNNHSVLYAPRRSTFLLHKLSYVNLQK